MVGEDRVHNGENRVKIIKIRIRVREQDLWNKNCLEASGFDW